MTTGHTPAAVQPCPARALETGSPVCAHGPWPCPDTRTAWQNQGLDPDTEARRITDTDPMIRAVCADAIANGWGNPPRPRRVALVWRVLLSVYTRIRYRKCPAFCDRDHLRGEAHGSAYTEIGGVILTHTLDPADGADLVRLGTWGTGDTDALLTADDRRELIAYLAATLPETRSAHITTSCHSPQVKAGASS